MTNEKVITILNSLKQYYNDKNEDSYVGFDNEDNEAIDMAIQALEQQPITWIAGEDNAQVAVRNMPIDKMQKICEIIGNEEQQPCEDCVSRENALNGLIATDLKGWQLAIALESIEKLPSVTPKFTDEEIQKMQELEQAQLDKAYELGKTDSFEEWLASFNTESATCCFTAVQELKEKMKDA